MNKNTFIKKAKTFAKDHQLRFLLEESIKITQDQVNNSRITVLFFRPFDHLQQTITLFSQHFEMDQKLAQYLKDNSLEENTYELIYSMDFLTGNAKVYTTKRLSGHQDTLMSLELNPEKAQYRLRSYVREYPSSVLLSEKIDRLLADDGALVVSNIDAFRHSGQAVYYKYLDQATEPDSYHIHLNSDLKLVKMQFAIQNIAEGFNLSSETLTAALDGLSQKHPTYLSVTNKDDQPELCLYYKDTAALFSAE